MIVVGTILAGAVAAVLRWLVALAFAPTRAEAGEAQPRRGWRRHRLQLPWAVLVVNIVGSAIAGVVLGLAERAAVGDDLRLILLTGFCGGLTTFSTWSVETVQLFQQRRIGAAVLSIAANLVLGVGACAVAFLLAR